MAALSANSEASNPPLIGAPVARLDGRLKVMGAARYGSDMSAANVAHAYLAISAIALGRIASIDDRKARDARGVLDILTYRDIGAALHPGTYFSKGGYLSSTIQPLGSDRISYAGEIVAVVVAESFEAAREGAHLLDIAYAEEKPSATFGSAGATTVAAKSAAPEHEDPAIGDAARAFDDAEFKVDASYSTPTQHHNPIELFTTMCAWDGDRLTVWESSQNVYGVKYGLAEQLGISADDIRVISPYVGGAFGSRGALTHRTALIALAARRLGRPVKLAATRDQGFTIATYRAETRQRVRLGAGQDGKLQSLSHEGWEVTSRPDNYMVAGTDATTRLYACANIASNVSIVHADRSTPGFMRAPAESPYMFGIESAMDELAIALKMDPVELRRVNDTQVEPIKGLHYTSRSLMPCFDAAAERFGWSRRDPQPGSMSEGDWLIGWGCAATMYPSQSGPATARVILHPDGRVRVQTAAHEIGNGAYTVIGMIAAERLGVPTEKVTVELGDTELPPAPVAGGSNTTASVCNVVAKACEDIRARLAAASVAAEGGLFAGQAPDTLALRDGALRDAKGRSEELAKAVHRITNGAIEAYAENLPHGAKPDGVELLYKGKQGLVGGAKMKDRIQFAFGAEFVEVRVHKMTREIRAPRIVGAFAAGRIMNERTARSQLMGGLIWGLSSALHEATEIDEGAARFTNTDLAEYLIPVNADIGDVEVIMLPEQDSLVNELGIKGLGELGNVGANAAVANAVYHATGIRIRDLPIRLEKLLAA
jgi:xanthine dehydrogenase YagR molybdenum-binding subunit